MLLPQSLYSIEDKNFCQTGKVAMKKEENHFFIATDCKNDKVGKPSARGCAIPVELHRESGIFPIKAKNATRFPFWRERGNDDNSLSSLAVSP